jgi:NADPH:quinone reductase-like Zn-dependent oxidoreductase
VQPNPIHRGTARDHQARPGGPLKGIAAGQFQLPIDSRYALAEAPATLARMKGYGHFGKIVLTI